jgi:hypothetical protein
MDGPLVFATVLDCRYVYVYWSKLNHCQIERPGCAVTRTIILDTGIWKFPNPSEMGRISVCSPFGSSEDSNNALLIAVC